MAGLQIRINNPAIALVATTAKTVLQIIAASNKRVVIPFIDVSFDGISPTDAAVRVQVLRQTAAIGGTPTAVTPVKVRHGDDETIQTTATTYGTSPTEPGSNSDVYYDQGHGPQAKGPTIYGPFEIKGGDRLGIICTSPVNLNCYVTVKGEE